MSAGSDAGSGAEQPSWDLRQRAESFGAGAEEYDAVRAGYPEAVVRAVLAGAPPSPPAVPGAVRVLDVGTGTGILARALRAAGADVVGTDVDAGMAAVARRSGFTVHVGPFEKLLLPERFDRVTVAQAWHWIEPGAGLAAARRLLAPGGQLWLIWNIGDLPPGMKAVVDAVYARFAGVTGGGVSRAVSGPAADTGEQLLRSTPGVQVSTFEVPWRAEHTTARWLRLVATFSDHTTLPAEVRGPLLAALAEAVDGAGGLVTIDYTTRVVVASGLAG